MYDHSWYLGEVRKADGLDVPHVEHMLDKLDAHCKEGKALGDFLRCVLIGDLHGAVAHADGTNVKYLRLYSKYCYNQLPSEHQNIARPLMQILHDAFCRQMLTRDIVDATAGVFRSTLRAAAAAATKTEEGEVQTLKEAADRFMKRQG
jgi:hypothetical protein